MESRIIVSMPSKSIRTIARDALKGRWKVAIIASIIYTMLASAPTFIASTVFGEESLASAVAGIYALLVMGSFSYGAALYFMSMFRKREYSNGQLFAGFECYGKTLILMLLITIKTILWTLLLVIPGIIASLRYSMSFFVMVDHPDFTPSQCIEESKMMMKGNKTKLFCLTLSFIGWLILASIPMCIIQSFMPPVGSAAGVLLLFAILYLISEIPVVAASTYILMAEVGLYEIMAGNLMEVAEDADGALMAVPDEAAADDVAAPEEVKLPEMMPETQEEKAENEDLQVIETVEITTEEDKE